MAEKLAEQIDALADRDAVAALAEVLTRQGLTVDPFQRDETEARLRMALSQGDVTAYATPARAASDGDMARFALVHLAGKGEESRRQVEQVVQLGPDLDKRADPATLAVGALVLLAFHSEVKLEKHPEKGWHFRFQMKPLKDSTVGTALGQLMGHYIGM